MNNNTTSNQENPQLQNTFVWEAPVLYTENWLNTLSGEDPITEALPDSREPS